MISIPLRKAIIAIETTLPIPDRCVNCYFKGRCEHTVRCCSNERHDRKNVIYQLVNYESRENTNEINNDYYCTLGAFVKNEGCNYYGCGIPSQATKTCSEAKCGYYHRKHPTPEQYKEEYGEDVPENMPVWGFDRYYYNKDNRKWRIALWQTDKYFRQEDDERFEFFVVACTPFGKPDDDWRPQ